MEEQNDYIEESGETAFKRRALREAGISYSAAAILPAILSFLLSLILRFTGADASSDLIKYLSFLLPQLCFAGTAVFFFRRSKVPPRETYRGCKWYYFAVALVLQFGVLISLSELNEYFVRFLEGFGYTRAADIVPSLDGWNLLPAILVIAVLPAIFEETIFRGILVGRMRESGWGTASIVLVSGALFSLFHANPEQTLYQFICGACFALIALRAGSVLPSVLAHLANNVAILALTASGLPSLSALPRAVYLSIVITSAVCLAGGLLFLLLFDRKKNVRNGIRDGKIFFLAAAAGIAICAVEWVALLIEGFV